MVMGFVGRSGGDSRRAFRHAAMALQRLRRLPDEVLAKLKAVAAEVVDASAAADPVASKVWAQQKAYLQRLYEYAEMNEKDIYNIRG
jgi:TRAP-type mannitol/chloroaromatic compound transport system substrate-binding protein